MKSTSNMKNETLTVLIAISLVTGGVISASAQQQQDRNMERTTIGTSEQTGQPQRDQPSERLGARTDAQRSAAQQGVALSRLKPMVRASELLDMEVHGQDGQKIGGVQELILSQDRRSVEHIMVSLDDGNSVKLSLDELSAKHEDKDVLVVRASKQELRQRQTQDRDRARVGREMDALESRQVSKLIGLDVQGTDGKDVGSIDDLIIDARNGQIMTAAIKTSGFLGLRTRLSSVEWQQINFAADGETATINVTKDQLSERAYRQGVYWDRHAFEGLEDEQDQGRSAAPGQVLWQDDRPQRRSGTDQDTPKVDNSGRNVRDRGDATLTPFDQGGGKSDRELTAQIREEIVGTDNMSTSGKNVKIITKDGQVTLRGPVDSEDEKRLIGEIANRIVRTGVVDNQLEVKATTTRQD